MSRFSALVATMVSMLLVACGGGFGVVESTNEDSQSSYDSIESEDSYDTVPEEDTTDPLDLAVPEDTGIDTTPDTAPDTESVDAVAWVPVRCDDANPCEGEDEICNSQGICVLPGVPGMDGEGCEVVTDTEGCVTIDCGDTVSVPLCPGPELECTSDQDCEDGRTCTNDFCRKGVCLREVIPDCIDCQEASDCPATDNPCKGWSCDSWFGLEYGACYLSDKSCCQNSGCDDYEPCTVDSCKSDGQCSFTAIAGCCTTDKQCGAGYACKGNQCVEWQCNTTADCNDNSICTIDTCNISKDGGRYCRHEAVPDCCDNAGDCAPGYRCSFPVNKCVRVECSGHFHCDDANPCTVDRCESTVENGEWCSNTPVAGCCTNAASCDDYDPCTIDSCTNNTCSHTASPWCVDADGDGFSPSQGDCRDDNKVVYPGAPELCDGLDNDCNGKPDDNGVCQCPATGAWIYIPAGQWRTGQDLTGSDPKEQDQVFAAADWHGSTSAHSVWAWAYPWGATLPAGVKCRNRCGREFAPTMKGQIAICVMDGGDMSPPAP